MPPLVRNLLHLAAACVLSFPVVGRASGSVTELPKILQPSSPLSDLAMAGGESEVFRIEVPPGATELRIRTTGGSGNCDLYLRRDAYPTVEKFNSRGIRLGNDERITVTSPAAGSWYLMLRAESAFRGVRLKIGISVQRSAAAVPSLHPLPGTFTGETRVKLKSPRSGAKIRYTLDGSEPTETSSLYKKPLKIAATTTVRARAFLKNGTFSSIAEGRYTVAPGAEAILLTSGVPEMHRGGKVRSATFFKITVPPAQKSLRILTGGGIGQSEIFVQHGTAPTPRRFTRRNNGKRNSASITIDSPAEGDWYILLRGRANFSGAFVLASVQSAEPDLTIWAGRLKPYVSELEVFSEFDCEVVEGMIEPGERRLLRYTTESRNLGGADLVMGRPEDHPDLFEYQDCHGHYHFKGFASSRLLDGEGNTVAEGKKVSFCLEDVIPWDPTAPARERYDCHVQGIQAGWADVYDSGLPGQWVDITGVPAGTYTLEVTVNPDRLLPESDYTNNTASVEVTIP